MKKGYALIQRRIWFFGKTRRREGGGALPIAGLKVSGAILAFFFQMYAANALGMALYGRFVTVVAMSALISLALKAGFDNVVLRFLPIYLSSRDYSAARGLVRGAIAGLGLQGMILGGSVYLFSRWSTSVFRITSEEVAYVAGISWLLTGNAIMSAMLRGLGRIGSAEAVDQILRPLFVLLIFGSALWLPSDLDWADAADAYAAGWFCSLMTHAAILWRETGGWLLGRARYSWKVWIKVGAALMLSGALYAVQGRIETLLLAGFAGPDAAALYYLAARFADPVLMLGGAYANTWAPLIAKASVERKAHEELIREIECSARFRILAFACAVVFAPLAAAVLLQWMAPARWVGGTYCVLALTLARGSQVLMGPAGMGLSLAGRHWLATATQAAGTVGGMLLATAIVPFFGAAGAATATAVTLLGLAFAHWILARRTLGVDFSAI